MTWREDIDGIAVEVDHLIEIAQRDGWQASDVQSSLGAVRDYMAQIRALLPTDVPPEPPAAPVLRGFAVSYPGHSPARDMYLGNTDVQAQWGPHHGLPLIAPVAGTVYQYQFPTPLANERLMFGEPEEGTFEALVLRGLPPPEEKHEPQKHGAARPGAPAHDESPGGEPPAGAAQEQGRPQGAPAVEGKQPDAREQKVATQERATQEHAREQGADGAEANAGDREHARRGAFEHPERHARGRGV